MSVVAQEISVTSAATLIASGGGAGVDKKQVWLSPPSADIALGGPGVTLATGLQYDSTSTQLLEFHLGPGDSLYAITATTATVRVLATRS